MAANYTDATDTNFKEIVGGVTYNIDTGKPLSAEGVRNALHTKENVANKVTALSASSTDAEYPSSKVVYDSIQTNRDALDAALAAKADDNNTVHKSEIETITSVKTFGTTDAGSEPKLGLAKTTDAVNDGTKFATEAQVYKVVQAVAAVVASSDILPAGTILAMSTGSWTNADKAFKDKWKVCDGTGGTPDLRDRFLRGGTSSDAATGGADSQTVSVPLKSHGHTFTGSTATGSIDVVTGGFTVGGVFSVDQSVKSNHIASATSGTDPRIAFSLTPAGTISPEGEANPSITVSVVPRYYTVIYIMKIA